MLSQLLGENGESIKTTYEKIRFGKLDGANFKQLYECLVAQSLVSRGKKVFYHTFEYTNDNHKKRYEIDFLCLSKGKVLTMEVKSTTRFTTSSLDMLKTKYPHLKQEKVVVSPKPLKFDNDITYMPIYMLDILDI